MDISRRLFLGGALALTGVVLLAPEALAGPLPVIYADGVRDDTAGVQALFDGKPFMVDGEAVGSFESGRLADATLHLSDTVFLPAGATVDFGDCKVFWSVAPPERPMIRTGNDSTITLFGKITVVAGAICVYDDAKVDFASIDFDRLKVTGDDASVGVRFDGVAAPGWYGAT